MKLVFPSTLGSFIDATGTVYQPDATGMLDIGSADPIPFYNAGFIALPDNTGTTGNRPTVGVSPGLMFFDTTLGKPIWRNAANNGWITADGLSA